MLLPEAWSHQPTVHTPRPSSPPVSLHPLVRTSSLSPPQLHRASSPLSQLAILSPVARRTRSCSYCSCRVPHICVSIVVSWSLPVRGIAHSCSTRSRRILRGQRGEQSCASAHWTFARSGHATCAQRHRKLSSAQSSPNSMT